MTINVLFTSIGRRVELLNAWKKAYTELGLSGKIIGTDIDQLAPAAQFVDSFHLVPPTADVDFIPALRKICTKHAIQLVFPLTDTDLPVLSESKTDLQTTGATVVVSDTEIIAKTGNKWSTYELFSACNLFTPKTWLPQDEPLSEFPLFIKPRYGSAGKHAQQVNDEQELAYCLARTPDPIIQEYIAGPEVTSDVLCDFSGSMLGLVSRERIEVRWGEVAKGKTIFDRNIAAGCEKLVQKLGVVGPITVQCIVSDNIPYFIEINARYGGGAPLGFAAGVNSPAWYLNIAAGKDLNLPPIGSYKTGLYLTRYDTSLFLNDNEIESNSI